MFSVLVGIIKRKIPPSAHFSADLFSDYFFPQHILPTDLRPDIVWWDDQKKLLRILELTIPFETTFADAAERKRTKYEELVQCAQQTGYASKLITIKVGARGVPHMMGFLQVLKRELNLTKSEFSSMLHQVSWRAIEGSFGIWCNRRNRVVM